MRGEGFQLKGSVSGSPGTPEVKAEDATRTKEPDAPLCCARCGHPVTREGHRTTVGGRHEHTRVNPLGIVFHFGCFSRAEGCDTVGPPTAEESWFPGYRWEIAGCGACHTHLGWAFRGEGGFFGLILDRLTRPS